MSVHLLWRTRDCLPSSVWSSVYASMVKTWIFGCDAAGFLLTVKKWLMKSKEFERTCLLPAPRVAIFISFHLSFLVSVSELHLEKELQLFQGNKCIDGVVDGERRMMESRRRRENQFVLRKSACMLTTHAHFSLFLDLFSQLVMMPWSKVDPDSSSLRVEMLITHTRQSALISFSFTRENRKNPSQLLTDIRRMKKWGVLRDPSYLFLSFPSWKQGELQCDHVNWWGGDVRWCGWWWEEREREKKRHEGQRWWTRFHPWCRSIEDVCWQFHGEKDHGITSKSYDKSLSRINSNDSTTMWELRRFSKFDPQTPLSPSSRERDRFSNR